VRFHGLACRGMTPYAVPGDPSDRLTDVGPATPAPSLVSA
jgi:hypothetical protein